MGRRVVLGILVSCACFLGLSLYLRSQQDVFHARALQGLLNDFQSNKDMILKDFSVTYRFESTDSWAFQFKGDELWVQAPTVTPNEGDWTPERAETLRKGLTEAFHKWLEDKPGDAKRFPIVIKFRNEHNASN